MSKSTKKASETGADKKPVKKIPKSVAKKGKTTKEMMNKHIQDENDIISDEDFKNLKLDMELPSDEAHQPLTITNDDDRPKDEDKDPKVITPWDVIN